MSFFQKNMSLYPQSELKMKLPDYEIMGLTYIVYHLN